VARRLIVGTGPAGVPDGVGSPLPERVSQARGALEAPVHPGCVATAFGHRRDTGVCWERSRGGVAVAWFAAGGAESGREDGASAWQGVQPGAGGRALGAVGHGVVAVVDGWHGDAELAAQGVHQEGRGGDAPRLGGQGCGARAGLEALVQDVGVAPRLGAEDAREGRAARERHGVAGRPLGEAVADEGGVCVVAPWADLGAVVVQGTGEASRETYVVADQTTARCDAWCEGTDRGALGGEGCACVARREPELTRAFGVSRVVLGVAGREGFPVPREAEGGDGQASEAVVLAPRGDDGARVALETAGHGWPREPRAHGAHPRLDGVWLVCAAAALTCLGASGLQADSVCGISPVEADDGRTRIRREPGQGPPPVRCVSLCRRDRRA
jgi:hypothetical protein